MSNLLFLDTETTGATADDRLCQVAFKIEGRDAHQSLFKPPLPIKIAAMAVTHITNEMVEAMPVFQGSYIHTRLNELKDTAILVAHNVDFDARMLKYEGIVFPQQICTLKIARYLDKGSKYENHQLQYLRYFYGLKVNASAHDAMGDVLVLEVVFAKLLEELVQADGILPEDAIRRAIEITTQPTEYHTFNFGKYKGKSVAEVKQGDRGYLEWLLRAKQEKPDGEEGWIYTLTKALK